MKNSLGKKSRALRRSGSAVYAAIGLFCALCVLIAWWMRPGFLASMDLKATDAMFALRGQRPAPDEVVIVAVDEKSVNEAGRWPWSRTKTAALVEALSEARTVALDMVFSEPQDERSDAALSSAMASGQNVLLGYFFRGDTQTVPEEAALSEIGRSRLNIMSEEGANGPPPWPVFPSIEANTPAIGKGAAGLGAFNTIPGEDGLYRDMNLILGYDGGAYQALPVAALGHYLGGDWLIRLAPYGVDAVSLGQLSVPADESGAMTLNFYGPAGSFRTYSAIDVLKGRVGPETFKGKLVFVGVTEKAVYDIRPTPLDALFPGVELHATAAANILKKDLIIRDGRVIFFDVAATAALPLLLGLLLSRVKRTLAGLGIFIALSLAAVAGEFMLFIFYNIKPAVIYPVLSLFGAYMSGEAYRNLVAEKRSRYLKRAFSSYVSPALVSEILDDPGKLKLGGERREITVLFSDIRGFTGISERFSPEELVEFLNRYLSPMTGIVLEEKGMVDKYIGDAIMAVFNAPVEVEGHAARACAAALRMKEALSSFNSRWEGTGYPPVEIGIGINTGEAVVGNMGAELKLNYTAIGDTVNLAARLEPMNKEYATTITVSMYTREKAAGRFLFRELDSVRVRGREAPLTIYELVGYSGKDPAKERLCRRFEEALALYRGGRLQEALIIFDELKDTGDGPSAIYAGRCAGELGLLDKGPGQV